MKNKLRILAICQEDPEWILGGMGRHLQELYKAMARREDVEIDLLVGGPAQESYSYCGYTKHHGEKLLCYKPKTPNMASLLVSDIQLITTLTRLIAQGKRWDLAHVHEWNSIQVARVVRDTLNIPLVGTMHLCITKLMEHSDPKDLEEPDIYLMQQEGHLIVDSDELILCSQAYVDLIRKMFMTDRSINLIYNGIDCNHWRRDELLGEKIRAKLNLPNEPIALFVGRIADMKGIRELLNAVENYKCPYTVVLAGEVNANTEEERESWEVTKQIRRIEEKQPHKLKWVGFQDDEHLRGLYSIADVGLMPSIHEPFGIVALEFMAMGVPLISTAVDGLGEIVIDGEEEFSLIIDALSTEQIYLAMKFLSENPNARNELKQLGKKRVLAFNWDNIAKQTVTLYKRVVEQRRFLNDRFNRYHNSQKFNAA
jgi:glycosyltransferase involved in cell wall biosynthesis